MKLKPQNTYKHILNFVSKLESRPLLNCIHITEEGHLEATNSHILIKLYDRVQAGKELIIHPKELRYVEGNYPDLSRLIPNNLETDFELDYNQQLAIFNFSKSLKKDDVVELSCSNKTLKLQSKTGINIKLTVDVQDEFITNLRAEYIKIVFDFLKDNTELVTVGFSGKNHPLLFSKHEEFDVLITPVRTK